MTSHNFRNQQDAGCIAGGPCCGNEEDWVRKNSNPAYDDKTDAEIAKDMNALSVQEREKAYEDIHGVAAEAEETAEHVANCIADLDRAILKIPKPKRRVLDRAFFLKPSLHDDKAFKLMFLRADSYDATKAAKRMVKFFEYKLKLFGDEKLVKEITLDDLDPKDIEVAVLSGSCLILPQKDQTGRPVIAYDISKFDHNYALENLRFTWYMSYTTLEEEVAQTRGVANLNYAPSKRHKPFPIGQATKNVQESGDMIASLPLRVTGYHFCTDDPKMKFVLNMIRLSHGRHVRVRLRPHFGSEIEMQYSLMTFGIQCKEMLFAGEGKTSLHDEYLQIRRNRESIREERRFREEESSGIVQYPERNDVLIGRGRPYHEYIGTRRLIEMIETDMDRYYGSNDRFVKTCVNMEIVKKIEEIGGRFLQRTKVGWKILENVDAREKTANLFRYRYNLMTKPNTVTTVGGAGIRGVTNAVAMATGVGIGMKRPREQDQIGFHNTPTKIQLLD